MKKLILVASVACALFAQAETRNITLYSGVETITGTEPTTIGRSFISGPQATMPTLYVRDTTVYQGDDLVQVGATNYTGGSARHWGKIVVSNANWFSTSTASRPADQTGLELNALYLGYKNGVGILEIQDGGFVSNKVVSSGGTYPNQGNGSGAVYVHPGAKFYQTARGSSGIVNSIVGLAQYGYLQQTGGLIWGDAFYIGGYGKGVFHMYGGMVDRPNQAITVSGGNGGTSTFYVTNGTVKASYLQVSMGQSGYSQVTVDGPDALIDTTSVFYGNNGSDKKAMTILNLNHGGALKMWQLKVHEKRADYEAAGNPYPFVVNFNGGVLRAYYNTPFFYPGSGASMGVSRVLVAEDGAILDTYGQTCTIPVEIPLEGVVEGGVQSIALDEPVTGLTGAPFVRVLNADESVGKGYGATAVADWDPETRTLKGVIVTGRGWGYTQGNVKVTLSTYAWSKTLTGDAITVGDNTIGGFTKRGTGTLTSFATNTWQKWTRIEAGTLKIGGEGTIPAKTELQLAGGDLDLNNIEGTTFCGVSGKGGKVQNGTLKIVGEWKISAKKFLTREDTAVNGTVDLTDCTGIRLVDTELEPTAELKKLEIFRATNVTGLETVPLLTSGNWKIAKSATGLTLDYGWGMMLIVR